MAVRKVYGPLINKHGDLNEETATFLRYYINKWKSKTIFQILLQYRAARIQDLYNFSQQVHLYNQKTTNGLQASNEPIDLSSIDPKANPNAWLGLQKPSVLKTPFRLDEIPFYDTSNMCESIGALESEESWDSPFKWRDELSKTQLPKHKTEDKLINLQFCRDPSEELTPLPKESSSVKTPKIELTESLKKDFSKFEPRDSSRFEPRDPSKADRFNLESTNFSTTKPANKDFDYIKPSPVKLRQVGPVNPIMELQKKGRRDSSDAGEAPFNFQGMLRKTNFARDSLKRSVETISLVKHDLVNSNYDRSNLKKVPSKNEEVRVEISPGIYLEGIAVDL